MKASQWVIQCKDRYDWKPEIESEKGLFLIFCSRGCLENRDWLEAWDLESKGRDCVFVSTSGELSNTGPSDHSMVINDLVFERSEHRAWDLQLKNEQTSYELGQELYNTINKEGLRFLWVFSDGHVLNGEDLMNGFDSVNKEKIVISGGMAGDAMLFEKTIVGLNGSAGDGYVVAIGFYGDHIHESHAYGGGWWQFGPLKTVTKSQSNVVYEINNENALDFYKKYLGEEANSLPESALLFPLAIFDEDMQQIVTRTILSIDMEDGSMVFAGNVPEGSQVKMMRSNSDDLVEASETAAANIEKAENVDGEKFALLISCVGRKSIYSDRLEEEFIAVKKELKDSMMSGFFSYGEFSPDANKTNLLHNQTLCISEIFEA